MPRRTLSDLQTVAQTRGGQCLESRYLGFRKRHRFVCAHRHVFTTTPNGVLSAHTWCPLCAGNRRGTIDKLRALAMTRGGECLSTTYTNASAHYDFRCADGHQFTTSATSVRKGSWCPACAGLQRRSLAELQAVAREKGGRCLSDSFDGIREKHLFVCEKGHVFKTRASDVFYGRAWCAQCAGNARFTLQDVHAYAAARGGECLSEAYENNKTAMAFRCGRGHEFSFRLQEVWQNAQRWCPACRRLDEQRSRYEQLRTRVERLGYTLVSSEYVSNRTKVLVRCDKGHDWWVAPESLTAGTTCGPCRERAPRKIRKGIVVSAPHALEA